MIRTYFSNRRNRNRVHTCSSHQSSPPSFKNFKDHSNFIDHLLHKFASSSMLPMSMGTGDRVPSSDQLARLPP